MFKKLFIFWYKVTHILLTLIVVLMTAFGVVLGLNHFSPLNLSRYHDISSVIRFSEGSYAHVFRTKDDKWRLRTNIEKVDQTFMQALIYCEDRYFWYHFGVNPFSLLRASYQYISKGKIVSGGSTLTMQVARLLEPRPRQMTSKLIEIFRAFQLEMCFSKKEILNIYLTLAPYGDNIEGLSAAALAYLGKSPQILHPAETALFIALPQSPRRIYHKAFTSYARKVRNQLLTKLYQANFIDADILKKAKDHLLPKRKFLPRHIPHLSNRLRKQRPTQAEITTFIDFSIQKSVEKLMTLALKDLHSYFNIGVMVVHHPTQKVLAYGGSVDFFENQNSGQIDYTQAIRSPGSTLKPFIYGLGFEEGVFQPNTLVKDELNYYGSYRPDNFEKNFNGSVTIEEALIQSLNIPVVSALDYLGPLKFLGLLEQVHITLSFPDTYSAPGLSLALGGVGMTLEQLMTLYTSLAQKGITYPLKYHTQTSEQGVRLFSPRTCQILTHILQKGSGSSIAFKTGTSYGHRDAWIIGYNASYVIGIWIGRPDGHSFGKGTGRTLALPLMEKIFQILPVMGLDQKNFFAHRTFTLKKSQKYAFTRGENKAQPLKLLFPMHDSTIDVFSNRSKSISLQSKGGQRPYTWLINQLPMATKYWGNHVIWTPSKKGFYTITLIDGQGQSESASVKIE